MTDRMTSTTAHVEIITSVQRRRRWTGAEKMRLVEETFAPGMTVSLVARQHGIAPNQLCRGSQQALRLCNCSAVDDRCGRVIAARSEAEIIESRAKLTGGGTQAASGARIR